MTSTDSELTGAPREKRSRKPPRPSVRLIDIYTLMAMLQFTARNSVYVRMRDDPAFPKARRFGTALRWIEAEVEAYIASLPVAEFDGLDAIERRGGPPRMARKPRTDRAPA